MSHVVPKLLWLSFLLSLLSVLTDEPVLARCGVALWVAAIAMTVGHWWSVIDLDRPVSRDFQLEKLALGDLMKSSGIGAADIWHVLSAASRDSTGIGAFRKEHYQRVRHVLRGFGPQYGPPFLLFLFFQWNLLWDGGASLVESRMPDMELIQKTFLGVFALVTTFAGWISGCLLLIHTKYRVH